jgi:hypothetical protein
MQNSRLAQRKIVKTKRKFPLKLLLIPVFILLLVIIAVFTLPSKWDGKSKRSIAVQNSSGDVAVVILDPLVNTAAEITIPKETETDAAYGLGTWKMGSITKLGDDENLGGVFLKNTIIKSFDFPITDWADNNFLNLISGNLVQEFNAIFTTNSTDFSILDKIKIASFALGVGNNSRVDINLSHSSYLQKNKLTDGSLGWEVSGSIPSNIESYFSIQNIANKNINVLINNNTGTNSRARLFANTLEVLGINVASIKIGNETDMNCKVTGESKEIVSKIADVFSCEINIGKPADNFDIQVDMGTKFKDRF